MVNSKKACNFGAFSLSVFFGFILFTLGIDAVNDLNKKLFEMIVEGNTEKVQQIIDTGIDVNAVDEDGVTFLMTAVFLRRADIVNLLLQAGADPAISDALGETAMDIARKKGYEEILEQLYNFEVSKHVFVI